MIKPMKVDAHIHSIYSDGQYTPQELYQKSQELGLGSFIITDHDTIAAYSEHKALDNSAVCGIELSTVAFGKTVHLLGYFLDPSSKAILDVCEYNQSIRLRRNTIFYQKIEAVFKIKLSDTDVLDYFQRIWGVVLRQIGTHHIVMTLAAKGKGGGHPINIYKNWMGKGKPLQVKADWIPFQEAVDIIHLSGGKAVLAHPHVVKSVSRIKKLISCGLDGLEVYYKLYNHQQTQTYLKLVHEYDLLFTGGSDFHSDTWRNDVMGMSWVAHEAMEDFLGK